jgi:hypothetical protein
MITGKIADEMGIFADQLEYRAIRNYLEKRQSARAIFRNPS